MELWGLKWPYFSLAGLAGLENPHPFENFQKLGALKAPKEVGSNQTESIKYLSIIKAKVQKIDNNSLNVKLNLYAYLYRVASQEMAKHVVWLLLSFFLLLLLCRSRCILLHSTQEHSHNSFFPLNYVKIFLHIAHFYLHHYGDIWNLFL